MEMKVKKPHLVGLGCPLLGKGITFRTCQRVGSSVPLLSTEYRDKTDLSTQKGKPAGEGEALRDTDLLISRRGVELSLAHRMSASLAGIGYPKDVFLKHGSSMAHPSSLAPSSVSS